MERKERKREEGKMVVFLPCAGVVTSVRVSERQVSVSANRAASDAEGSAPETKSTNSLNTKFQND